MPRAGHADVKSRLGWRRRRLKRSACVTQLRARQLLTFQHLRIVEVKSAVDHICTDISEAALFKTTSGLDRRLDSRFPRRSGVLVRCQSVSHLKRSKCSVQLPKNRVRTGISLHTACMVQQEASPRASLTLFRFCR